MNHAVVGDWNGYPTDQHRDHTRDQAPGALRGQPPEGERRGALRAGEKVAQVAALVDAILDTLGSRVQAAGVRVRTESVPAQHHLVAPGPQPPQMAWRHPWGDLAARLPGQMMLEEPGHDRALVHQTWHAVPGLGRRPAWMVTVIITVPDPQQAAFLAAVLDLPLPATARTSSDRQDSVEVEQVKACRESRGQGLVWVGWVTGVRPHVPLSITVTTMPGTASGNPPGRTPGPVYTGVSER